MKLSLSSIRVHSLFVGRTQQQNYNKSAKTKMSQLSNLESIEAARVSSKANLLRATTLHSINEWKLFLLQHLKDKYIELSVNFDALPAIQKKERTIELKDFLLKVHVDEPLNKLSRNDIYSKCANGSNITTWYEFLQSRIQVLPTVLDISEPVKLEGEEKSAKKPKIENKPTESTIF